MLTISNIRNNKYLNAVPNNNTLIKWIAGHNLPMVEHLQAERLALRMSPQICLKAKGIYCRDECFYCVQRRPRHWSVLGHVTC